MNLQELTRKYVEIDVKAMEDVLNFIRRRQRAEKELDDDFDYSMLYEYILKEQEYVKMKIEEKAIREAEEELLESKNKYMRENNSVLKWLDTEPKISNEPIGLVYEEYALWTQMEGLRPLNRINFGRELSKEGWVSKPIHLKGKTVRVYLKE